MTELDRLHQLLNKSGDPRNPSARELRDLLHGLGKIAVVGLSRYPTKPARRVPSYLAAKGLTLVPVNPYAEWLLGRRAYPDLEAVEEPVDLVLVFRPSHEAGAVIRSAAARPETPGIWLQQGIRADVEAEEARGDGRTVVQDLCIFKAHRNLRVNVPRPLPHRESRPVE